MQNQIYYCTKNQADCAEYHFGYLDKMLEDNTFQKDGDSQQC